MGCIVIYSNIQFIPFIPFGVGKDRIRHGLNLSLQTHLVMSGKKTNKHSSGAYVISQCLGFNFYGTLPIENYQQSPTVHSIYHRYNHG